MLKNLRTTLKRSLKQFVKLHPNIVLNRVFQFEKQFCLDFRIFLCQFGRIHYFLGFRTSFTLIFSMVKNVMFGFCRCFLCSLFFAGPFLCTLFVVLYAWWELGGGTVFLDFCMCRSVGRLWFEVGYVYEVHCCERCVQGFVGSFCFAPTVACVSQTSFVFCC